MRDKSVYVIPCICGEVNESHAPEVMCRCGQIIRVEGWGKPARETRE